MITGRSITHGARGREVSDSRERLWHTPRYGVGHGTGSAAGGVLGGTRERYSPNVTISARARASSRNESIELLIFSSVSNVWWLTPHSPTRTRCAW